MLLALAALLLKLNLVLIVLVTLVLGAWCIRPTTEKNIAAEKPASVVTCISIL